MWRIILLALFVFSFANAVGLSQEGPKYGSDQLFNADAVAPVVSFSGWFKIDGAMPAGADLDYDDTGKLHIVVRGIDDVIYYRCRTSAGGLTPWVSLGGATFFDPAITFNPVTDEVHVFVTGTDSQIYQNTRSAAGVWSGWSIVPFGTTSQAPGAATDDLGKTTIIVKDIVTTDIWLNDGGDSTSGGDPCVTKTVRVADASGDLADFTIDNPCSGNRLAIHIAALATNTDTFSVCPGLFTLVQGGVHFTSSDFSLIEDGTSFSLCEDMAQGITKSAELVLRPGASLDFTQPFSLRFNGIEIAVFP